MSRNERWSLRGRIAINERISRPGYDGREATSKARLAAWEYWLDLVDPERTLPEEERIKKAKAKRQAALDRGKLDKLMGRTTRPVRERGKS